MKMILGCLATTILTLMASPASAVMLCPDETGAYTPEACDFILPIEPNPRAIECNMMDWLRWRATSQGGDPRCVAHWEQKQAAGVRLKAWLDPAPADPDVCRRSWEKWERIRVDEFGWAPAEMPRDRHPLVCQISLDTPDEEIRQILKEVTEACGGDCRRLVEPDR